MKDKLKSIIGNGLPYGVIFFGLSFLIGYLFHINPKSTLWMSSFLGISALLANGLVYNRFSRPLKDLENITIVLEGREVVLVQAPANHLIDESLVPGKLFLTNQRMVFKAHRKDENGIQEYSWRLSDFKPINFYGSLWNSGGEFLLRTNNEASLMFEVNNLKLWKDAFRNA